MKFNETSIPQNYSQTLFNRKPVMSVEPEHTHKMYEVLFTSMADFLRLVRANSNKVALAIYDPQENLILAGIVETHENTDEAEMPGNLSFVITTDAEDLTDAKVYTISDQNFLKVAVSTATYLHGIVFSQQAYVIDLFTVAASILLNWLDTNASEKEEKTVELDGYFVASVAVESGEKVFSIVPHGAMKRLIKDDTSLEK